MDALECTLLAADDFLRLLQLWGWAAKLCNMHTERLLAGYRGSCRPRSCVERHLASGYLAVVKHQHTRAGRIDLVSGKCFAFHNLESAFRNPYILSFGKLFAFHNLEFLSFAECEQSNTIKGGTCSSKVTRGKLHLMCSSKRQRKLAKFQLKEEEEEEVYLGALGQLYGCCAASGARLAAILGRVPP